MDDHGRDHNGKNIGWAILINIGITIAEAVLSCHACMEESDRKGYADRIIQAINGVLQQNHGIEHTVIQAETRNLCGIDVLCNK